jgi:hypothetical protein
MSRGIISKVIDEIGETQAEVRAEEYTMVNVRPGGKASVVVAGDLSTRLAAYAYSSSAHADAIINAAQEVLEQDGVLQPGSALDILNKADVLEVESSFEKELCSKLFSK